MRLCSSHGRSALSASIASTWLAMPAMRRNNGAESVELERLRRGPRPLGGIGGAGFHPTCEDGGHEPLAAASRASSSGQIRRHQDGPFDDATMPPLDSSRITRRVTSPTPQPSAAAAPPTAVVAPATSLPSDAAGGGGDGCSRGAACGVGGGCGAALLVHRCRPRITQSHAKSAVGGSAAANSAAVGGCGCAAAASDSPASGPSSQSESVCSSSCHRLRFRCGSSPDAPGAAAVTASAVDSSAVASSSTESLSDPSPSAPS